ncbi:hypothetical protein F5Y16DRAFT_152694 [Xylariaceae sp. FL0255]|nr:hypothetical protein F5Y16DRAFT_152694 [Xylariaceae sp. FL0255]
MHARHLHGHGHGHNHLHSRVLTHEIDEMHNPRDVPVELPTRIVVRDTSKAAAKTQDTVTNSNTATIALSIVIPLLVIAVGIFYVARRGRQRRAREDAEATNKYKSMDFGLEEGGTKRKSGFPLGKEKNPNHKVQLSMDMNLSSPYLLPPTVHGSRESMNSLTKSLNIEDPYRPVMAHVGSDVGSMRSFRRSQADRTSSIYTSNKTPRISVSDPPNQHHQRDNVVSPIQTPPSAVKPHEAPNMDAPTVPAKSGFRFTDDSPGIEQVPKIQEPEPVATAISRQPITREPHPVSAGIISVPEPQAAEFVNERESMLPAESETHRTPDGLGIMDHRASRTSSRNSRASGPNGMHSASRVSSMNSRASGMQGAVRPPRTDSMPVIHDSNAMDDYSSYADHFHVDEPNFDNYQDADELHIPMHREEEAPHSAGLGVPGQDTRRLSVGFRPLPPDEMLESEDPEFRANRIRSFYKEYFEEDGSNRPPMPGPADYHEDYDAGYLGEAAYFDPDSNAFVMPYAQPVTRRAMTPPPSNRRPMPGHRQRGPPGPRGPPGGMRGPPGERPRAGSTMSASRFGPMSPRPGSSASNTRFGGKPKTPLPPPSTLSTLPTPSKLKDDSFALMGSIDFAPPPTFRDQAAGRSQSPLGERKPYQLHTPIHSPLVSAFDETASLPSPHLLRKSGTFTGLDFAPPRRFKDPETMSDSGSVRSMQSGISNAGLSAIRAGAGRVSRLPGDMVFTQAAMGDTLKPQWGMRA